MCRIEFMVGKIIKNINIFVILRRKFETLISTFPKYMRYFKNNVKTEIFYGYSIVNGKIILTGFSLPHYFSILSCKLYKYPIKLKIDYIISSVIFFNFFSIV